MNADTFALEEEIDSIVYKLYGLTDDEIAVVEKYPPSEASRGAVARGVR